MKYGSGTVDRNDRFKMMSWPPSSKCNIKSKIFHQWKCQISSHSDWKWQCLRVFLESIAPARRMPRRRTRWASKNWKISKLQRKTKIFISYNQWWQTI